MEYQPYRPQAFDEDEPRPAERRIGLPAGADFEPGPRIDPGQAAPFEEGSRGEPGEPALDFASLKFQRENTLLTNAESYAASIREEAQLYVRQLRSEVESLNREAEQRYEEAERIKSEAQSEAERVLAEAQLHVSEVREQARQEGFEAGKGEGIKLRYEEAGPNLERLDAVLGEISQFRKRVAYYTEKDGVRLALLIAKKILQAELKVNKQIIARLVASTLAKLQGKGTFRIWLNPGDYQFIVAARASLERFLDEEQALTLRAQPDLRPGNVLIETDREVIDLTFESQFYHLEQQFKQKLAERESVLLRRAAQPAQPAQPDAGKGASPPARRAPRPETPPHAG